ncbi:unnamed protein product [Rotaria magnacalcarata]|uniref:Uncharacterized protein n=1 Tax=Rotaria magnacalcarata TaxID=392030 RepID=A0A816SX89_9BILA|nr:unnamed protein product [Rotaria magnacalcarata]
MIVNKIQNKNQGLIDTLVNHNNQLKQIENKFEFITNNFANSSHVKEIVEKTKEIGNHAYGSPRPHKSWRELLLLLIAGSAVVLILVKIYKKFALPRVKYFIRKIDRSNSTRASSISEQVEMRRQSNKNKNKLDNKTMVTDSQLKDQLVRIHSMMRTINENMPKIKGPFRAEQTGGS